MNGVHAHQHYAEFPEHIGTIDRHGGLACHGLAFATWVNGTSTKDPLPLMRPMAGKETLKMTHSHRESHKTSRIGWLRAAVLGANDGIIPIASLAVGIAGLVAGVGRLSGAVM